MIYSSRYLLVTLLVLSSLAAFYFLPIGWLLHYVGVYYRLAVVVAVVVVPLLYLLRVLALKLVYALVARLPQPTEQAPAETRPVSSQSFPDTEPLTRSELQLP